MSKNLTNFFFWIILIIAISLQPIDSIQRKRSLTYKGWYIKLSRTFQRYYPNPNKLVIFYILNNLIMRKWLKIWIAALALLWVIGWLFLSDQETQAASSIQVILTNAETWSTCNDNFSIQLTGTVKSTDQTLWPKTWDLVCYFNKTLAETVSFQVADLTWPQPIPAANVKLSAGSTCKSQAWVASSTCKSFTAQSLSTPKTIMSKAANTIGTATHALGISVLVPAYSPQWTYGWTVIITVS